MELVESFKVNNYLNEEEVKQIFEMTLIKWGDTDWSESKQKHFEYACHLALVSEYLITEIGTDHIENIKPKYWAMMDWVY